MKILLRISTDWKVWDFDFLRGLAPGRLDGFLIEMYERNSVPFGFLLRGLKAERCDFVDENRPGTGAVFSLLLSFYAQYPAH